MGVRAGTLILITTALLGFTSALRATNGDQMLGVNAMQWGMGGAVTAAPQEAAILFHNPAGLAGLEFEEVHFDLGLGFMNPPRSINGVDSDSDLYFIPAGALAMPLGDDWVLGLGMGGLSGQGVDVPDALPAVPGNQAIVTTKQFFRIAPSLAYRVNSRLSAGVSLNLNYQSLALSNPNFQLPQDQVFGWGMNFGLLYQHSPALAFGASYLTQQNMDAFNWNTAAGGYALDLDAPAQFAIGMKLEPGNGWLIAADIKRIQFSDVLDRETLTTPTGTATLNFGWDDQTVYALGIQKKLDERTTLRMGLNYGASPIDKNDVDGNLGSLAITEKHLSIGFTRRFARHFHHSVTLSHAFENELTSSSGSGNTIKLEQNLIHLQISYQR